MLQLTLRTLLAYIDDTLEPTQAQALGKLVAESEEVKELVERVKKVTRRRGLATPGPSGGDETADPNTVAAYLDNALDTATIKQVEEACLGSDAHLAEVASCHQILTLVLAEPARVPPHARRRMYQLVPPPAAEPGRKPNKSLPIGGVAPPTNEENESDDADAALLLGLKRYGTATTWASRFVLFGVAAVLLVLLAGAALLSLQRQNADPPEVEAGHSSQFNVPVIVDQLPTPPKPKDVDPVVPPKPKDVDPVVPPKPKDVDPVVPPKPKAKEQAPPDLKPVDPGPGLGDPIPPPSNIVRDIAVVKTSRVLVVTQPTDGAGWTRLRVKENDDKAVESNAALMALPGYKADVSVENKVLVRLWGNVPEQLSYRVFESRVKFHVPPPGFDADITLLGGRIYLKSEKPTGAKVRLRLGTGDKPEVWDVMIPDATTDVLAELVSWFAPGTPYAKKGGSKPKLEGRVAVVFGTAAFETSGNRFKKIDKVPRWHQVMWDSVTDTLSDSKLIEANQRERLLDREPSNPTTGELNKQVTRLLTSTAEKVTTREVVGAVIKDRVGPDLPDISAGDQGLVSRLSVYARAALSDSSADGAAGLSLLVDVLRSELPWLSRQAVVTALVNWLARDVGNTERLHVVLTDKGLTPNQANRLLLLLRGYLSPTKPAPAALDQLVEYLADEAIPVREAALWHIMVARLESWVPLPLGVNIAAVGANVDSPEYGRFLTDCKKWIEEIKQRHTPPKK